MDISTLEVFIDVVRRGSFAAVARERDVAPSSISRSIASLEEELGILLFQRTTRQLRLTEAGTVYFARVETIIADLSRAHVMASDVDENPKGRLRLTLPVAFGQHCVIPLLSEFSANYPELLLDILMTDSSVDLLADNVDVAIQLGPLSDSTHVASRLCAAEYAACASADYIAAQGRPNTPAEIQQHACLILSTQGQKPVWRFRTANGMSNDIAINSKCFISNTDALKQCVLNGMGLSLLPRWSIRSELRSGELIDIFPDFEVSTGNFDTAAWLLYPSRSYLPLKVRAFVDFMKQKFSEDKSWEEETATFKSPLQQAYS